MRLRDLRGHFAKPADNGRPCPHACCNGSRRHPAGTPLVVSARLRRKLEREAAGDTKRLASKKRATPASNRARDREALRLAMHAQDLRAENYGMGYKAETAGFYGSTKHAQAEQVERRLRTTDADLEARARAEHDREEAAAYRSSRKTRASSEPLGDDFYTAWA